MTIQQHASFGAKDAGLNATSKANPALTKLVQMWENNNAKRAIKSSGVSLMALSLTACGGSDDVAVDITSDNAAAILTAITAVDAAATTIQGVADNAADAEAASTLASINSATGLSLTDTSTGAEVIAAIQGTVDITTDNAALIAVAEAAATTAALTATDLTVYANVDAAKTAGLTTTSTAAVTAALTDASLVVHATVDAAITSNDAAITAAETIAATAAAEATLVAGTGFATVAALSAAYNTAIAATPALDVDLTSASNTVNGTVSSDAIDGTSATYTGGDIIVDANSADSDTLTITATNDITATPTVAGIENVIFNLNSLTAATANATAFDVDTAGIAGGTVTLAVTMAGSAIAAGNVTNVNDGVIVATALTTVSVAGAAGGNHTVSLTSATAQTLTQTAATDDLTINSGSMTLSNAAAEEAIVINATGSVTVTDIVPAVKTLNSLDVNAAGAITITDLTSGGHADLDTSTGNITVSTASKTGAMATGANLIADTDVGNVTVTNFTGTGTITADASGDISNASTTDDGDITITQTDATVVTATVTGGANIDDVAEATTLTLNVGQASDVDRTNDNIQFLTVSSTSASAAPTVITLTAGDGAINGANDGVVELDTITFTGSNSVTLGLAAVDMNFAAASTSNGTSAASVIATDNMTGGTSRIALTPTGAATTNNVSALAVDEISLAGTFHTGESFSVANGQKFVITGATTNDLALTASAVAGQSVTVSVADDLTAASSTVTAGITTSNVSNLILESEDLAAATAGAATGAVNVGAANKMSITGAGAINVSGAFTGAELDGSNATGAITVSATNTLTVFKGGSANDTFTSAGNTNLSIDGNGGQDTLVLAAADYSGSTLTLSDIEVIDANASGITVAGNVMHNSSFVITGGAADTLAVVTTVVQESIDMSATASAVVTTITGGGGADGLTGSATTGTAFVGAAGSDTIIGGAGVDTVTVLLENAAQDTITLGGGSDIINMATTVAATANSFVVTDMNLGTSLTAVDTFNFSILGVEGLAGTIDLVDTSTNTAGVGNGTVVALSADGATVANADLVVLQGTYATAAAALVGLGTAGGDTITYGGTLQDDDVFLIAYTDGTSSYIAAAKTGTGSLTTSAGIDAVTNLMTMTGVSDLSILDSSDYAIIA